MFQLEEDLSNYEDWKNGKAPRKRLKPDVIPRLALDCSVDILSNISGEVQSKTIEDANSCSDLEKIISTENSSDNFNSSTLNYSADTSFITAPDESLNLSEFNDMTLDESYKTTVNSSFPAVEITDPEVDASENEYPKFE